MTWMIEAHSVFLSMSASEDFWTLRILPRIGRSAWWSALRAVLAVPRALSPSTMNSSVRSTSSLRQSTSLAGSADDSRAVLRRWVSRWARAATRARMALAVLSSSAFAAAFSPRGGDVSQAVSSFVRTLPTIRDAAGVPRTSFVWPSNCGSASRTATTAVRPSITSSLAMLSSFARRTLAARSWSLTTLTIARSKPATCVPPLGVAMTLTKERSVVS